MIEKIHEKIEVITLFRLTPQPETRIHKIRWRGKEYPVNTISYHYKIWEGRTRIHKFAVSTEKLDFRISYDSENLFWMLEEISDGF